MREPRRGEVKEGHRRGAGEHRALREGGIKDIKRTEESYRILERKTGGGQIGGWRAKWQGC